MTGEGKCNFTMDDGEKNGIVVRQLELIPLQLNRDRNDQPEYLLNITKLD